MLWLRNCEKEIESVEFNLLASFLVLVLEALATFPPPKDIAPVSPSSVLIADAEIVPDPNAIILSS